ncbi:MAG TPA: hypothetical protein VFH40_15395, partial [Gemmatimonadales bacterium]|nr:hypothetical protein [Gemmatimonadales bacterium]
MPHPERRWTRLLAIAGTSVLTLVVAVLALLQLPPVATWVMRQLVTLVPLSPGYRLEVARVSGDWIHRLVLGDVRLLEQDRELARIDRLQVGYDLRRVRGAVTRLNQVSIDGAQAVARRQGDFWDLARALKSSADTSGPRGQGGLVVDRVDLRDVQLAVELSPDSLARVRGLDLRARDLVLGQQMLVTIDQLNAGISPPGTTQWFALATRGAVTAAEYHFDPVRIQTEETRINGRAVLPRDLQNPRTADRLDLQFQATPLALADLAAIVPTVAPEGDLRLDASARGDTNGLVTARLGARLDQSTMSLRAVAPLAAGKVDYRVSGSIRRFDPARFYRNAPPGSLNGRIDAELRGPALNRANGRVDLRLEPSRLAGTSVRRLQLGADLYKGSAAITLRGAVAEGTLEAKGRVRPFDSIPGYRLRGSAHDLTSSATIARTLSGDSSASGIDVRFALAGAGVSPAAARVRGTAALSTQSRLSPNAARDRPSIPLGHATVSLARGRLELIPTLLVGGGTITGRAIVRLRDTLTYELRDGKVDRVNLAHLTADTALGPLTARFTLLGRGTAPDQAVASARIYLDELHYGARTLTHLTTQIRLAHRQAWVEINGPVQGGQLSLAARARPFGKTKTFELRQASLDNVDLGSFLGRPDLAGPVTLGATASGRTRGESRSVQGRLTVSPSRLGRVQVRGGVVTVALGGDSLTFDGSVTTNGGRLTVAGDARPLAPVRSFAIHRGQAESLDLGTLLGRPGLRTGINATFTAQLSQDSAVTRKANVSFQLLPSRINQAELDSGNVALNLNGSELDGDVRLQGRDIEVGAELDGRTGPEMQLHTTGTARVERLGNWTGNRSVDGRIESSFQLTASGDSAGLVSLHGNINAIGGVGAVHINSAQIAMRPDSGAIRIDTLFVRSNVATLSGRGRIALRQAAGTDTLRITGVSYNVGPLAELLGDSISLDSARMALTVTGPAWHWRVASEARANRVLAAGNLAEQVTLRATASLDSTRIGGVQGELGLSGGAYGKTRIPEARLTGRYDSLLTLDANVAVGDSARVIAALRGTVRSDSVRATLQRLDLVQPDSTWSLEQPVELELKPRITIDGFALASGRHRIFLEGVYDPRSSSDIEARFSNVNLEALQSLGLAPIGGRLDGWVRYGGSAPAPTIEGSLGLGIRAKNGREVGHVFTKFGYTREEFRIDAAVVPAKGGRLTVNGTLPTRSSGDTL